MTLWPRLASGISGSQVSQSAYGVRTILVTPLLGKGVAIGAIHHSPHGGSVLLPKNKSRCWKPSPTKRSSPSRTCGCSKKSRSATQNCAKRWSIRQRRPRCSASSAARPRTCSRSSTPSSRARRGFVGSMTWRCDSAKGTVMVVAGSFWSHTHTDYAASRSVSIASSPLDSRAWHAPRSRRRRIRTISQRWFSGSRTFLTFPSVSQGDLLEP